MLVALIADIHGNLTAFEAVIADFGSPDEVWCLGDTVGFGPDPDECVERLRGLNPVCVAGNHDWAVIGKLSTEGFNADAASSVAWTSLNISQSTRDYLLSLPTNLRRNNLTLVHGSPRDPINEYLFHPAVAVTTLDHLTTKHCLVAHTHVPAVFYLNPAARRADVTHPAPGEEIAMNGDRLVINPGSVGQPRDGIPDARYIILDTDKDTFSYRRVPYDVARTQEKMGRYGLPARLAYRIAAGV